jgi:hypothetical protein
VAIGSDVQAYDAQLASVAGWTAAQVTTLGTIGTVTTGANQIIVTSGADTFAAQSCTAAGLALLDDADASAQRTTLGLGDVSTLSIGISDGNVLTANNAVADNDWLRIDGTEVEGRTDAEIKADLSLEIGTDVQAYDAQLADVAGLAVTNGGFIVGDGSNFVLETGATARTSIGLGTADNVEFEDTQVDSLGVGTAASGTTGEIRATNDVTAYYSSDVRLKKNIKPIDNALLRLDKINGYEFDWKKGRPKNIHSHEGHAIGVSAQEIMEVLPEVVQKRDNGYLAVDYQKIVALLINGIKELKAEIEEIKDGYRK